MATKLTKQQRERLAQVRKMSRQRFLETGVSPKSGLKGTNNTARPVGYKRETVIKHKTIGGGEVELNANAKAKLTPVLGKPEPKIEISKGDAKSVNLTVSITNQSTGQKSVVSASASVTEDLETAFYDVMDELIQKHDGLHRKVMESFVRFEEARNFELENKAFERAGTPFMYSFTYRNEIA